MRSQNLYAPAAAALVLNDLGEWTRELSKISNLTRRLMNTHVSTVTVVYALLALHVVNWAH